LTIRRQSRECPSGAQLSDSATVATTEARARVTRAGRAPCESPLGRPLNSPYRPRCRLEACRLNRPRSIRAWAQLSRARDPIPPTIYDSREAHCAHSVATKSRSKQNRKSHRACRFPRTADRSCGLRSHGDFFIAAAISRERRQTRADVSPLSPRFDPMVLR